MALGVACDIGNKSILFTLQRGVYGLTEERKCSNWKLMSYGDFTSENILKTLDFNDFVQADMWKDYALVSEVLAEFGAINSPDNPQQYENAFQQRLSPADLEGRSYLEIQEILAARKFRELLAKQSKELQARIAAEQAQSAMLISSIAGLFDEFEDWLQERKLQQKMLKYDQLKTGETKEAENYDDDEYELY